MIKVPGAWVAQYFHEQYGDADSQSNFSGRALSGQFCTFDAVTGSGKTTTSRCAASLTARQQRRDSIDDSEPSSGSQASFA